MARGDDMRRRPALLLLVVMAMFLVAWYGTLCALPHHHGDHGVPTHAADCAVAFPGSGHTHVHPTPGSVPFHGCLACLAAGTAPEMPDVVVPVLEVRGAPLLPSPAEMPVTVDTATGPRLRAPPHLS